MRKMAVKNTTVHGTCNVLPNRLFIYVIVYYIYCFSLSLFPYCLSYGMQNPLHQPCWLAFQAQLSQINLSDWKSFLRPCTPLAYVPEIVSPSSLFQEFQHAYDASHALIMWRFNIADYAELYNKHHSCSLTLDHSWWRVSVRKCIIKVFTKPYHNGNKCHFCITIIQRIKNFNQYKLPKNQIIKWFFNTWHATDYKMFKKMTHTSLNKHEGLVVLHLHQHWAWL